MNPPPSKPASGAMPYIAISGSDAHEPVDTAATRPAAPAADLERHDDPVADLHLADGVADGDDLGQALVADGMSGRHRQLPLGDGDVEVATRHRNGRTIACSGVGDLRFGASRQAYRRPPRTSAAAC